MHFTMPLVVMCLLLVAIVASRQTRDHDGAFSPGQEEIMTYEWVASFGYRQHEKLSSRSYTAVAAAADNIIMYK